MRIANVEHSPIPGICSVKTERLVFTARELSALERAKQILSDAEGRLIDYFPDGRTDAEQTMIYLHISMAWGYIEEILEAHHPNGIRLEWGMLKKGD